MSQKPLLHFILEQAILEARLLGSDYVLLPITWCEDIIIRTPEIAENIVKAMHGARTNIDDSNIQMSGKIFAIKALRSATHLGLKDAKDLIEDKMEALGYPKPKLRPF